jgi:hypothetical protein
LDKSAYWKIDGEGNKIYFIENKSIGDEFTTIKYIMLKEKVSSSNAHKIIKKIKELKQ